MVQGGEQEGTMLLAPWALREGLSPTASGITLTVSDAFLLRAEPLSSDKTAFGMETT